MNNFLVTFCVLLAIFHANAVETDEESNLDVLFVKKVDTSTKTQFLIPSDTDEATKNSLLKVAVSGSACGCGQDKCCCKSNDDKSNPTEEEEEEEETPSTEEETTEDCTDCTILRINVTVSLPSGLPLTDAQKLAIGDVISTTINDTIKSLPKNAAVDEIKEALDSTLSTFGDNSIQIPQLGETDLPELLKGIVVTIEKVTECIDNSKPPQLITVDNTTKNLIADVNLCALNAVTNTGR